MSSSKSETNVEANSEDSENNSSVSVYTNDFASSSHHSHNSHSSNQSFSEGASVKQTQNKDKASPYQNWFLRKELEKRKQIVTVIEKERENELIKVKDQEIKMRRMKLCEEAFTKWCENKDNQTKEIKINKDTVKIQPHQIPINKKIPVKYTVANMDKTNSGTNKPRKKSNPLPLKKECLTQNTRQFNIPYEEWFSKHSEQEKSNYSLGYSSGVLIAYYDQASNPKPTFCNPEPWDSS